MAKMTLAQLLSQAVSKTTTAAAETGEKIELVKYIENYDPNKPVNIGDSVEERAKFFTGLVMKLAGQKYSRQQIIDALKNMKVGDNILGETHAGAIYRHAEDIEKMSQLQQRCENGSPFARLDHDAKQKICAAFYRKDITVKVGSADMPICVVLTADGAKHYTNFVNLAAAGKKLAPSPETPENELDAIFQNALENGISPDLPKETADFIQNMIETQATREAVEKCDALVTKWREECIASVRATFNKSERGRGHRESVYAGMKSLLTFT